MNVFKTVTAAILLTLIVGGCGSSVTTFYYRMAAPPEGDGGISFYRAPAEDATVTNVPDAEVRNVIYLIGDGMGFEHVELTRLHAEPTQKLWMELFPVKGQQVTRSANHDVTDSAAAGTALACGIKTNNGMLGMNPNKVPYSSILELLDRKGWRTGLVATSSITHATPAAFSAHVDSRGKEREIALQQAAGGVDVMLGGGTKHWKDETYALAAAAGYTVVTSRDAMLAHKSGPLVGLFAEDGMTTFAPEPMLHEMTATAIGLLSAKGSDWFAPKPRFFLMVEGSQIDWAGHANDTERMVRQTLLFDMAVREALEFARRDGNTLVIVTSDHETGGLRLDEAENTLGVKAKWTTGNHTGANVPIYAFGPGAEMFAGTLDNTEIPKRIAKLTGVETFPVKKADVLQTAAAVE
jgi:alkaline phosphatase